MNRRGFIKSLASFVAGCALAVGVKPLPRPVEQAPLGDFASGVERRPNKGYFIANFETAIPSDSFDYYEIILHRRETA